MVALYHRLYRGPQYARAGVELVMKVTLAILAAALAIAAAGSAGADPYDPAPAPPYQIGQSPALPGNRPYQPHCADVPISCALHFNIDGGRWVPNDD